jgi:RHS repeat-associated protein
MVAQPRSHSDHLNTPRLVADATGTTVWRWDQAEPFGSNPANDDPDGNAVAFDLPLRLPGQRYDAETALHYNYFRDYDPSLGRYGESDPVGLLGGLNTYAYVLGSPIRYNDPLGLWMPYIHKMMTEDALARVKCDFDGLPLATADVDIIEDSQKPIHNAWHQMAQKGQSAAAAQADIDKYLKQRRNSCELSDLARVLHSVQDGISPAHGSTKVWSGDESLGQLIRHGLTDMFPSAANWEQSVSGSVREIQAFVARCPCICR